MHFEAAGEEMFAKMMFADAIAVVITMLLATESASAMTDDEAQKVIKGFTESFVSAEKAGDAMRVAQHFAKNSIRVGPSGITNGWEDISDSLLNIYKVFRETEDTVEVVKAIDDCSILVSGKWSGVLRETINLHGYYSFLAICEGSDWKIKADMYSFSPDGMPPAQPKQ